MAGQHDRGQGGWRARAEPRCSLDAVGTLLGHALEHARFVKASAAEGTHGGLDETERALMSQLAEMDALAATLEVARDLVATSGSSPSEPTVAPTGDS